MAGNYVIGWFDHWGTNHHGLALDDFKEATQGVFSFNGSINFFMFVGGSNFGFWNGANDSPKWGYGATTQVLK